MARPQYPFDLLRRLRDERAEAQALALAEQVARVQQAQSRLEQRSAACRQHDQRTHESLRLERERLAAGQLSGADLQRQVEFEAAASAQAALLARAESEAADSLARERAEQQRLQQELGQAESEAQLLRQHESIFHEEAAQAQQRREEEAAQEQWNARRH